MCRAEVNSIMYHMEKFPLPLQCVVEFDKAGLVNYGWGFGGGGVQVVFWLWKEIKLISDMNNARAVEQSDRKSVV